MPVYTTTTSGQIINNSVVTVGPGHLSNQSLNRNLAGATFSDLSRMDRVVNQRYKVTGYWDTPDAKIAFSGDSVNPGAANTAAVITYGQQYGQYHVLGGVAWSYTDTLSNGRLTIQDGSGNYIFDQYITTCGPGFFPFKPLLRGTEDTTMIITLAAGGAGCTGTLNTTMHWVE